MQTIFSAVVNGHLLKNDKHRVFGSFVLSTSLCSHQMYHNQKLSLINVLFDVSSKFMPTPSWHPISLNSGGHYLRVVIFRVKSCYVIMTADQVLETSVTNNNRFQDHE